MNALLLALSLTSSFTKVGAIAGFVALVGIALLSLLAFAQAREIKRLREWAGRAPERAAEMEQRVSTEAAARLQREGGPAAAAAGAAGARVASGARVVPRKTPLVSAPVSTAVNATVAAGKIGSHPDPTAADPSKPVVGSPGLTGQANPGATGSAQVTPDSAGASQPDTAQAESAAGRGVQLAPSQHEASAAGGSQPAPSRSEASSAVFSPSGVPKPDVEQRLANGASSPATVSAEHLDRPVGASPQDDEQSATTPATAAARAAVPLPRSPLPPSPSAPMPPGVPASTVAGAGATAAPAPAVDAPAAAQPAAARPPGPVAAARPGASRAVAGPPAPSGSKVAESGARKPVSPRARTAEPLSAAGAARMPGRSGGSGPKYFKRERSSARGTLLILAGVVVGVVVIALAVSALKGGSKPSPTVTQSSTPSATVTHTHTQTPATNPSELNVAVLNATSTAGLAHHLAEDLQQSGYKHAEASSAVPPGTHASTVIEYRTGHRADGQGVARALNVTRVQPMEGSTVSLAGHATVVVVAGADQSTQLGGGGQGTGEPASGASGETASGAGAGAGSASEGTAGSGQ